MELLNFDGKILTRSDDFLEGDCNSVVLLSTLFVLGVSKSYLETTLAREYIPTYSCAFNSKLYIETLLKCHVPSQLRHCQNNTNSTS